MLFDDGRGWFIKVIGYLIKLLGVYLMKDIGDFYLMNEIGSLIEGIGEMGWLEVMNDWGY